jgi:hypothetical protein
VILSTRRILYAMPEKRAYKNIVIELIMSLWPDITPQGWEIVMHTSLLQ